MVQKSCVELESVLTCRHVLQHLQQHVLSLIDELSALHHQFPQTQVAIQHCSNQPTFEMALNGLHLHERREQSCSGSKHIKILKIFKNGPIINITKRCTCGIICVDYLFGWC